MKRSAAVLLFLLALSSPTQAALVTLVHALPALPDSILVSKPIDIAINGKCQYVTKPYGSKIGPKDVDAGEYVILFYEAKENAPCRGTLLGEVTHEVGARDEIDVVLGLDENDLVAVSIWDNRPSIEALAGGASTAVEVRHVGASPKLKVELRTAGEDTQAVSVLPGDDGLMTSEAGKTNLRVTRGREVLDKTSGKLKAGYVYWTYVAGSGFKETLELVTFRAVPQQRPIPDDKTPPSEVKPKYSACCLYGTCSQLSMSACQQASGLYIGDVACSSEVC